MAPTWTWQTWQETTYLTCSLLEAWPHGFFTRQSWPQTPQELTLAIQPQAKPFRVKQVHGNRILSSSEILQHAASQNEVEAVFPDADGLYSDRPCEAVWVCSADCTPVLIADANTGRVAAVHAGWRGTAAKIVPEAIVKLLANGSQVKDLRVAMGPAIAGEVYQVSTAVAAEVGQSILDLASPDIRDEALEDERIVRALMQAPNSPVLADEKADRARLDVRRVNAIQLQQLGLAPAQIAIAPHCTYQDPERFFSYRRDSRRQVQWSGIASVAG
ncbi:peptidoglycan editing factor PgeF [Altericista sp. CCNU0014]|uniref:peptidoglycan editing factor PgeF n=1 Tax=Altericista sp. CCNU0014 TaxID=3082949 RepID=UPI00384E0EBC